MMALPGVGGRGNGELFNGYKLSVLQNDKVLKIGCTTMWINLPWNCTLKNGLDGKLYVYFTMV